MPDMSVTMFITACTACRSRAQMPAEVKTTTFSSCEGLKVKYLSTQCSSNLTPASAFQQNTPTCLLHPQQAMGSGHAAPTLNSSDWSEFIQRHI